MKAIKQERSLADQVFESIRASILNGQLAPGSLHSVKNLADELEVSRTPVREALIDLAAQGMVRFERNRGVRILQTSAHDLLEIFGLRLLLEVPAAAVAVPLFNDVTRRAVEKEYASMEKAAAAGDEPRMMEHDRRFHTILLVVSGNHRLARTVDQLRDLIVTRGVSTVGRSRSLEEVVAPHAPIYRAIVDGDRSAAARAMRDHVLQTGKLILTQEGGDAAALDEWARLARIP